MASSTSPHLPAITPAAWTTILTPITSLSPSRKFLLLLFVFLLLLLNVCFFRLANVLTRDPVCRRPLPSSENPTHLMVVLGSGGHTAEMLNILGQYDRLKLDWMRRTYVVSSGDGFSASKAREFEIDMASNAKRGAGLGGHQGNKEDAGLEVNSYNIVTVHRARRVHQSLLTTPLSSLRCLWDCIKALRGAHPDLQRKPAASGQASSNEAATKLQPVSYPDVILTNGPGTGVIVVLASIILLFFGLAGPSVSLPRSKKAMKYADSFAAASSGSLSSSSQALFSPTATNTITSAQSTGQMRTIFVESWARVKTLSLSGRLLKPFVDRFLVQWPQLAEREGPSGATGGRKVEYVGSLVA